MFDGEIVKKIFPLKKILGLENICSKTESKTRSKTKLDLENFHQKIFFCKKPLNVMFDGEIVNKKFPFKKNFGLGKYLVQDKVGLRKFSPKTFFCKKP